MSACASRTNAPTLGMIEENMIETILPHLNSDLQTQNCEKLLRDSKEETLRAR